MSVSDGQLANQNSFNLAFLSRLVDTSTIGVVALQNVTDANSGAFIANVQRAINETFAACGITGEGDASSKVYASNNYIADGETYKQALGALDTNVKAAIDAIEVSDIDGPGSSVNDNLTAWDGTSGLLLKDSGIATSDVVTKTGTQTLTNKEYDGGTASNTSRLKLPKATTAALDALTDVESLIAYDTTLQGPVYNDGTGWSELGGSGSGTGGVNHIPESSRDFEDNGTGNWLRYDDAGTGPDDSIPVDGTGGGPGFGFQTNLNGTLRGNYRARMSNTGVNHQGEGVACAFSIDDVDKNTEQEISFVFDSQHANLFVGDDSTIKVWIYALTGAQLIEPTVKSINSTLGEFKARFQATDSTSYRLILHIARAEATVWQFYFDDVRVGPVETVYGAMISGMEEYTPDLLTTSGLSSRVAHWRRVGDKLEGTVRLDWSSAPAGADVVQVGLPSGLSMDTSKLSAGGDAFDEVVGSGIWFDNTNSDKNELAVTYRDANSVAFVHTRGLGGTNGSNTLDSTDIAGSDYITGYFSVPILGWTNNIQLANQSTFRMSSILANGTYLPSGTPSKIGEYVSYSKTAAGNALVRAVPTTPITSADGLRIHPQQYTSGQASGLISVYDIFIGKNKHFRTEFYNAAGRTDGVDADFHYIGSTQVKGAHVTYSPVTGILTIDTGRNSNISNTSHLLGVTGSFANSINGYCDVIVSENVLAVGCDSRVRAHYNNTSSAMTITSVQRFNPTNKVVDTHGAVTTGATTWQFTAPKNGLYMITTNWTFDGGSVAASGPLSKSSNSDVNDLWVNDQQVLGQRAHGSINAYLNAGDTFYFQTGTGSTVTLLGSVNSNYIIITEV